MVFQTGYLLDPLKGAPGEAYGSVRIILTSRNFKSPLKVGLFAKVEGDVLQNLTTGADQVLAGVVLRKPEGAVEQDVTITDKFYSQVEYLRWGCVTVFVKDGDTPTQFGKVYAVATTGEATTTATNNIDANAEFIEAVDKNIWLIRLK